MSKVSKTNAQHYIWGHLCDGWHLVNEKDLSVIHERMPPQTAELKHVHSISRQFFFILSGEAVMEMGGEEILLQRFEGIEVPPKVLHRIYNKSDKDIEFLVISQPTSRGDRENF